MQQAPMATSKAFHRDAVHCKPIQGDLRPSAFLGWRVREYNGCMRTVERLVCANIPWSLPRSQSCVPSSLRLTRGQEVAILQISRGKRVWALSVAQILQGPDGIPGQDVPRTLPNHRISVRHVMEHGACHGALGAA
eukprot:358445-Chlamydomonas_euryale.AAC.2